MTILNGTYILNILSIYYIINIKYFTKDIEIIKEIPEPSEIKESAITMDISDSEDEKIETTSIIKNEVNFYIPDESVFTKGTLRSFKMDFKQIDFKNEYMLRAFNDAIMITINRDDVENVKATSYKFFRGCLDNKIIEYKLEEQEDIKHKKELEIHW